MFAADEEPWSQVKAHLDEAWFVDADVDAALDRVIARQVSLLRCRYSDMLVSGPKC